MLTTGHRGDDPADRRVWTTGPFWTNKEAIWKPTEPPRSLAVIGAGAIGIEFAQIYSRFGTEVTVLEALPHILPAEDDEAAAALVPALEEEGISLRAGVTIDRAHHSADGWQLELARERDRSGRRAPGGHRPPPGLRRTRSRRPRASSSTTGAGRSSPRRSARPGRTSGPRETPRASCCSPTSAATRPRSWSTTSSGRPRARDYRVVPRVTFCDPEVASVGLTEAPGARAGPRGPHVRCRR